MRIPIQPPDWQAILDRVGKTDRLVELAVPRPAASWPGKYLHWDKLRHLKAPKDWTHEEWWLALKLHRLNLGRALPLVGVDGNPFTYLLPEPVAERLLHIDQEAGGTIRMPEQIVNPATRDQYMVNSLVEEAITSSQLEGASTTRLVAKEMVRTGRPPHDRSEQMILNNYRTMQRIGHLKTEPLTIARLLELHRLTTESTLDDPTAVGRLRNAAERIDVATPYNEILHVPPPSEQLEDRLRAMCEFANGETPDHFIHPVVRAIILHFWLAYDHPFVDGNGRCARALFYWCMLHNGYWLFEFVSISALIRKAPAKYGRVFLYVETDENDLTYFILYHLDIIHRAIGEVHAYVERKTQRMRALESELRGIETLNHRQRALVAHALRHASQRYTIASHRMSHGVVYETARSDLRDLAAKGLLEAKKVGRTWTYRPASDLERRLAELD